MPLELIVLLYLGAGLMTVMAFLMAEFLEGGLSSATPLGIVVTLVVMTTLWPIFLILMFAMIFIRS